MSLSARLAAVVLAAVGWASGLSAQTSASVRLVPARPLQGAMAWLEVLPGPHAADSLTAVEGDAAGEPLHFRRVGAGYRALLGVPLDDGDSIAVALRLARTATTDTTTLSFPLTRPPLRSERLRVDPAMTVFDSATRARIDREQAQAREISRRSHDTARLWWSPFRVPRPTRITSVYGTARVFNGAVTSRHMGTDFEGKIGAPVLAAGRGVVALVADFFLAGRAVYLDHGGGLVTGYFHLSRADVAEGDTVAAGGRIGAVGRSGRVTGPHLHWIARYGTVSVDPMSLVRLTQEIAHPATSTAR